MNDKLGRKVPVAALVLLLSGWLSGWQCGPQCAGADWTATCTSGCVCKWADGKKVAECVNAGYTTVPQHLSPEIQVLDLKGNRLDVLVDAAFSSVGLVNLQRIHLRNCSLRQVAKGAFADLSILIEVDVSMNQLRRIHPDTFVGNERLRFLSLSHNRMEKLEAHQFPALPHLKLLELVDCALELVDKKAFMHLSALETLRLSENRFRTLRPEVFSPLVKLKSLDLHDNPWNCDCRLVALRDSLSEANLNSTLTLCAEPQALAGRPWSRLATPEFACRPVVQMASTAVEGRLGFDVTFSCRVAGSPPPSVWWLLQDQRSMVNASGASASGDQLLISTSPLPSLQPGQWHHEETQHWSNLTIRRISQHDVGQYRCLARNRGGQAEANVTLRTPAAPIIVILEEETGLSYSMVVSIASVAVILLLMALLLLIVCLCRRKRSGSSGSSSSSSSSASSSASSCNKHNGSLLPAKSNGSSAAAGSGSGGAASEQEKALLEQIEMDSSGQHIHHLHKSNGYQPVSQTEFNYHRMQGSSTYIPAERFESIQQQQQQQQQQRHLPVDPSLVNPDGSFYPDLLDIPHRGRGGGSPSTNSGASTVPEVFPLNAANLQTTGHQQHIQQHPGYTTPDYRVVAVHPPIQFTDSVSSTTSLIPAGSRPGYVTLPRRPRPRIPSWNGQSWSGTGTPPVTSPVPPSEQQHQQQHHHHQQQQQLQQQPLYDTIGPRVTADGSSSSALSLNKIAGLTPCGIGSPNSKVRSCSTLGRGHKISLPAYYVPIEEVATTPNSHPHPHHPQTSTPNHTTTYPVPEILSPIPAVAGIQADLRIAGSRSSISSVHSQQSNGIRKKTPPAVAPKPSGLVNSRRGSLADDYNVSGASSPLAAKIGPKPPPKPNKQRLSIAGSIAGSERLDEETTPTPTVPAPFEDEGEDGTEV